jgi:hypothetical protein
LIPSRVLALPRGIAREIPTPACVTRRSLGIFLGRPLLSPQFLPMPPLPLGRGKRSLFPKRRPANPPLAGFVTR